MCHVFEAKGVQCLQGTVRKTYGETNLHLHCYIHMIKIPAFHLQISKQILKTQHYRIASSSNWKFHSTIYHTIQESFPSKGSMGPEPILIC